MFKSSSNKLIRTGCLDIDFKDAIYYLCTYSSLIKSQDELGYTVGNDLITFYVKNKNFTASNNSFSFDVEIRINGELAGNISYSKLLSFPINSLSIDELEDEEKAYIVLATNNKRISEFDVIETIHKFSVGEDSGINYNLISDDMISFILKCGEEIEDEIQNRCVSEGSLSSKFTDAVYYLTAASILNEQDFDYIINGELIIKVRKVKSEFENGVLNYNVILIQNGLPIYSFTISKTYLDEMENYVSFEEMNASRILAADNIGFTGFINKLFGTNHEVSDVLCFNNGEVTPENKEKVLAMGNKVRSYLSTIKKK